MLHNYSYKPEPIFGFKHENEREAGELQMGLEIEVEPAPNGANCSAIAASDTVDDLGEGRLYCKPDGSLDYGGFEIVSHPGTLGHHMYVMRWKRLLKAVRKTGRRSHDARHCGLHVHVGRKELGETTADRARVIRMVKVVMSLYKREMTVFSRRTSGQIDQWAPIPTYHWLSRDMTVEDLRSNANYYLETYNSNHGARYTAVNVTNESTVEIRIFRGTLKRDTLIASLQLVNNLFEWCMDHDWNDVLNSTFVEIACYKPYREIVQYLQDRNLLDHEIEVLGSRERACDFTTGNA